MNLQKKKFVISVDGEGLACVVGDPANGLSGSANYPFAVEEAVREVNAAAKALFDHGAEEVIVWDSHGMGVNIAYEKLDSRCKILLGLGHQTRFPLLDDSFGGVLLLGYHSCAGTGGAVLSHSYRSRDYQFIKLDGRLVGEMQIDAAFAGVHGVPVMFVSSDQAGADEAQSWFPWAQTVSVKQGLSWNSALSLHPQEACRRIEEGVTCALSRLSEMPAFSFSFPASLEIRFCTIEKSVRERLIDKNGEPFAQTDAYTRCGTVGSLTGLLHALL